MNTLNNVLKDRDIFIGCTFSQCRVLQNIGFQSSKNNRKQRLMELCHVVIKRVTFCKNMSVLQLNLCTSLLFLMKFAFFRDRSIAKSWQGYNAKSVGTKTNTWGKLIFSKSGMHERRFIF